MNAFQTNPYIIKFDKYRITSTDAKSMLQHSNFEHGLSWLDAYLKEYGTQDEKNELIKHKASFEEYKKNKRQDTIDDETLDRQRKRLNHNLLDFIDSFRPSDQFSKKEENTLRVKSEWDIRVNLIAVLQFSIEPEKIERIFKQLTTDKKWKALIRVERRYVLDNGDIGNLILDGIELNEDEDFALTDCKTDNEVRFDYYLKNDDGTPMAGLLVEFFPEASQISIRANGSTNEKCMLTNELISWFEQQVEKKRLEDFSLCIPSARGFIANTPDDDIESPKIAIKMAQPIQ